MPSIANIKRSLSEAARNKKDPDHILATHIKSDGFDGFLASLKHPEILTSKHCLAIFREAHSWNESGPMNEDQDDLSYVKPEDVAKARRLLLILDNAVAANGMKKVAKLLDTEFENVSEDISKRVENIKKLAVIAEHTEQFAKLNASRFSDIDSFTFEDDFDWLDHDKLHLVPKNADKLLDLLEALPLIQPRGGERGGWQKSNAEVIGNLLDSPNCAVILRNQEAFSKLGKRFKNIRDNFTELASHPGLGFALRNMDRVERAFEKKNSLKDVLNGLANADSIAEKNDFLNAATKWKVTNAGATKAKANAE